MRNLARFPITLHEKIEVLEQLAKERRAANEEEERIGDITGVALMEIIEDVKTSHAVQELCAPLLAKRRDS